MADTGAVYTIHFVEIQDELSINKCAYEVKVMICGSAHPGLRRFQNHCEGIIANHVNVFGI